MKLFFVKNHESIWENNPLFFPMARPDPQIENISNNYNQNEQTLSVILLVTFFLTV